MWSHCRLLLWRGTCSKGPVPDYTTIDIYWSLVSCWPFVIVYRISSTCTIWETTPLTAGSPNWTFWKSKVLKPNCDLHFPCIPSELVVFWNMEILLEDGGNLFEILLPRVSLSCGPENAGGKGLQSLRSILWEPMVFFPTSGKRLKWIWWHQRSLQQLHPHLNWTGTGSWEPTGSWHWNISESQVDDGW